MSKPPDLSPAPADSRAHIIASEPLVSDAHDGINTTPTLAIARHTGAGDGQVLSGGDGHGDHAQADAHRGSSGPSAGSEPLQTSHDEQYGETPERDVTRVHTRHSSNDLDVPRFTRPKRTSTVGTARTTTRSGSPPSPILNANRPPPFSRKVTKSLFVKPADQRVSLVLSETVVLND
jgi:hypothetical protein